MIPPNTVFLLYALIMIVAFAILSYARPASFGIQQVLDQNDVISLAAMAALIFWAAILFTQIAAAVMYTNDPITALNTVWEAHKMLIIAIFVAYGVIKPPNGE